MFLLPRRVEVARAIVNFINFYTMRDSNGFLQGKPGKELRVDALQGPGCYVCLFAYMKASPAIWVHRDHPLGPPMSSPIPCRFEAARMHGSFFMEKKTRRHIGSSRPNDKIPSDAKSRGRGRWESPQG